MGSQLEEFWSLICWREQVSEILGTRGHDLWAPEPGKHLLFWSGVSVIPSPFGISAEYGLCSTLWFDSLLPGSYLKLRVLKRWHILIFMTCGFTKVNWISFYRERFSLFPDIPGDIADPRSTAKARLGSLGLPKEAAAGLAGSQTRAGFGMSRGWCGAQSPPAFLFLIPCGTCSFTVHLPCGFYGESVGQWKGRREHLELKYLIFFSLQFLM